MKVLIVIVALCVASVAAVPNAAQLKVLFDDHAGFCGAGSPALKPIAAQYRSGNFHNLSGDALCFANCLLKEAKIVDSQGYFVESGWRAAAQQSGTSGAQVGAVINLCAHVNTGNDACTRGGNRFFCIYRSL